MVMVASKDYRRCPVRTKRDLLCGAVICHYPGTGGVAYFDDRTVQVREGENFWRSSPCIVRKEMVKVCSATTTRDEVSRGEVTSPWAPVAFLEGSKFVEDVLLGLTPLSFEPDNGLGKGIEEAWALGRIAQPLIIVVFVAC